MSCCSLLPFTIPPRCQLEWSHIVLLILCLCVQTEEEMEGRTGDDEEKEDTTGPDFNYLLSMPMWYLTKEKKEELCRQRDAKVCVLQGSDVELLPV